MTIERDIYQAAEVLALQRYPKGWAGAAAIRTASGKILCSVAPDTKNDALALCMEVGAMLEAHKIDELVTHSLCLYRENENTEFRILTPCGICQERLVHWGGDVQVAVTCSDIVSKTVAESLHFVRLRELQPFHWSTVNGTEL